MSGSDFRKNPNNNEPSVRQAGGSGQEGRSNGQQSVFSKRSGIQDPLTHRRTNPNATKPGAYDRNALNLGNTDGFAGDEDYNPTGLTGEPADGDDNLQDEDYWDLETDRRYHNNQAHQHQKRRRQKRRKLMMKRLRMLLKLAFAAGWALLLWNLANSPAWILERPRFTLENMHLITDLQVAPLIRPLVGKPLYQIDTGKVAAQLQARFPILETVAVRRQLFPARLEIIVNEKQPWAEVFTIRKGIQLHPPSPNKPPIIREHAGIKISTLAATSKKTGGHTVLGHPVALLTDELMTPLSSSSYELPYAPRLYPGHIIEPLILSPSTRYSKMYLNRLQALTWKARRLKGLHLLWTDARNPNQVVFQFKEIATVLGRLDDAAEHRLARLLPLIPKINELQDVIDSADLRWEEQVTLHTRPNVVLEKPDEPQGGG